jgi:hypothetical protein
MYTSPVSASFTCPVSPSPVGTVPAAVLPYASYLVRLNAPTQFAPDSVPLAQLKLAVAAIEAVPCVVHDDPESVYPAGQP